MEPERGYIEARRLLKERYGQGYKIATALVERLINGPPIRNEDCNALQKLSVALTNCKNILQDVGYLKKVDILTVYRRLLLPHTLRRSLRDKTLRLMSRERSLSMNWQSLWTRKPVQWPIRCLETLKMIQGLAERIPKGQQIEEVLTLLLLGMMEATLMLTISSQIHPLIQLRQQGYLPSVPFAIVITS